MEILIVAVGIVVIAGFALVYWRVGRGFAGFANVSGQVDHLRDLQERTDRAVREEIARLREEVQTQAYRERTELGEHLKSFSDGVQNRLAELTLTSEKKIESVRAAVDEKLRQIQEDNFRQLERMRQTVDEKLHSTLETRLGEAFKLVSDRLEQVQKGLGEMQSLATGVGDLKKVLLNVKTKGVLGECQLGAILEQILTPAQYEQNVRTKEGSGEHVEFAVKIPSKEDSAKFIWLPIDAKFPTEDYTRLLDAYEAGNVPEIEAAAKSLRSKIEKFAKDISGKYLDPPHTTDFAIMFLPFEGLFAEVLRMPGLFERIQRDYRVTITGPTTVSAFLNSLQMGFRTLAIQKSSSEVWKVLGEVKTAFAKFGETLDAVRKKIDQAASTVDEAQRRTRVLSGKLRAVESLPEVPETREVLVENVSEDDVEH
ncbi:MAG TPA: DNA recombination protein RmuC, partial [Smithella sp.]|nr:DNA recombination protein RmuC [Smithella sp.]HRS97369.1 DNA recombination protein RmuC [Smithella sp.]